MKISSFSDTGFHNLAPRCRHPYGALHLNTFFVLAPHGGIAKTRAKRAICMGEKLSQAMKTYTFTETLNGIFVRRLSAIVAFFVGGS